jgi:hypothetical protein
LKDVISALNQFESENHCRIILTIRSCGSDGVPGIWWDAKALEEPSTNGVRALLASVQLSCAALNVETMTAAVFNLLYQLDFLIAEREFESAKKPGA